MKKIYLVVDFAEGFYETERDYTSLKAVSTDLNKLCESFKKSQVVGQLLEVDESKFNTDFSLDMSSDAIDSLEGIKNLGSFSTFVKDYFKSPDV